MYTVTDYKSKKQIKEDIAAGKQVRVYQPNKMTSEPDPTEGIVHLEGPHYPKAHTWYAEGTLKDGVLVKIK